jgi:putative cell wall-binding protein
MKRAVLPLLAVVLLVTVGIGIARAASPKALDRDNRFVQLVLADVRIASPNATEIGARGLRVWGDDRYETAVAISQTQWDPVDETFVFLAVGTNFPDALAGSAAAAPFGPVLLTQKDSLPQVTANEISRLQPCGVIALGGTGAISDAVVNQAQSLTTRNCESVG